MLNRDPELLRALCVEEYIAIRAEAAQAKAIQQSVVHWSLTGVGIAIAGLAAIVAGDPDLSSTVTFLVLEVALLGAIPLILACAFAVWCGEIARMERAGQFLRSRERALWPERSYGLTIPDDYQNLSIVWENALVHYGKNVFGSMGVIFLFTVSTISSLMGGGLIAISDYFPPSYAAFGHRLAMFAVVFAIVFLLLFGFRLQKLFRKRDDLEELSAGPPRQSRGNNEHEVAQS